MYKINSTTDRLSWLFVGKQVVEKIELVFKMLLQNTFSPQLDQYFISTGMTNLNFGSLREQ